MRDIPVAVNTADWEVLSFSAGRAMSAKPAKTRLCVKSEMKQLSIYLSIYPKNIQILCVINLTHLNIGAQKKTVFGPKQKANQYSSTHVSQVKCSQRMCVIVTAIKSFNTKQLKKSTDTEENFSDFDSKYLFLLVHFVVVFS